MPAKLNRNRRDAVAFLMLALIVVAYQALIHECDDESSFFGSRPIIPHAASKRHDSCLYFLLTPSFPAEILHAVLDLCIWRCIRSAVDEATDNGEQIAVARSLVGDFLILRYAFLDLFLHSRQELFVTLINEVEFGHA